MGLKTFNKLCLTGTLKSSRFEYFLEFYWTIFKKFGIGKIRKDTRRISRKTWNKVNFDTFWKLLIQYHEILLLNRISICKKFYLHLLLFYPCFNSDFMFMMLNAIHVCDSGAWLKSDGWLGQGLGTLLMMGLGLGWGFVNFYQFSVQTANIQRQPCSVHFFVAIICFSILAFRLHSETAFVFIFDCFPPV